MDQDQWMTIIITVLSILIVFMLVFSITNCNGVDNVQKTLLETEFAKKLMNDRS